MPVRAASSPDEPGSIVEEYVARLADGDVAGAMELRCRSSRIPVREHAAFGEQVARLEEDAGVPLEAVEVEDVTAGPLVVPGDGSAADVERHISFRLRTATGSSEPMQVVTVNEGGSERLCGYATVSSFAFREELASVEVTALDGDLDDLDAFVQGVQRRLGPANTTDPMAKISPIEAPVVEGRRSVWRTGVRGGFTVEAYRYDDGVIAAYAADTLIWERAPDGVAMLDMPPLSGAVAFRHTGVAWTLLQPADVGEFVDVVVAVIGDVVVRIALSPVGPGDDGERLVDVAAAVAAAAAG